MRGLNFAIFLSFTLLWLASSVQCDNGGQGFYSPLRKRLIQAQRKISRQQAIEKSNKEHSHEIYIGPQEGLKEANKISALPRQPNGINFDQYSGFVTVDANAGRALFYYFAESENSSTKPIVLWLDGGGLCSSLGYGAMSEVGPFRPNKDGETLGQNPYAWNKVANVLFLEAPVGVGFSYSNTSSDYDKFEDNKTAADSYTFLVNWFKRFPEYKARDFYITGEGYAGHYTTQLAQLILHNNKYSTNRTPIINLKGIAVGNPYFDYEAFVMGTYDYAWSHALISDEIYEGIVSSCNIASFPYKLSNTCKNYLEKADAITRVVGIHNIYTPSCSSHSNNIPSISAADPCSEDYVVSYLNNLDVQKSLHADVTGKRSVAWALCMDRGEYGPDTVVPILKELIASGIRVWLFSGDINILEPLTETKYLLKKKLGLSVKTWWYPWNFQGEIGGFVEEYQHLTFVTIKGAGYMIPADQPARALAIFSSFLEGKLPSPSQT